MSVPLLSYSYTHLKKNKTKQNKTKQNKTKQNKTKQNKTKQNKTKQNKIKFHAFILFFHRPNRNITLHSFIIIYIIVIIRYIYTILIQISIHSINV